MASLKQHYPLEFSKVMEIISAYIVQYGNYQPHVITKD